MFKITFFLATLDELRASYHAGRQLPILGAKLEGPSPCSRRKTKAGRSSKTQSKRQNNGKTDGSEPGSGEESESEHEKNSCQQFSTLMQNIKLMDRELAQSALVCAENFSQQFDLIFLDRKNMDTGTAVRKLTVADRMLLTYTIFCSEKDNAKSGFASC